MTTKPKTRTTRKTTKPAVDGPEAAVEPLIVANRRAHALLRETLAAPTTQAPTPPNLRLHSPTTPLKFAKVADARQYVYAVLQPMLTHEFSDPDGWMFGGIDNEFDRRRLTKAIHAVIAECARKSKRW